MNLIRNLVDQRRSAAEETDEPTMDTPAPAATDAMPAVEDAPQVDQELVNSLSEAMPSLHQMKTNGGSTSRQKPAAVAQPVTRPADEPKAPAKKVWDLEKDADAKDTADADAKVQPAQENAKAENKERAVKELRNIPKKNEEEVAHVMNVPDPLLPRKARQAGRVKTRIMGFGPSGSSEDPFARAEAHKSKAKSDAQFPVGWLVVVKGPGRGNHFALQNMVSTIGRAEDQVVSLNFGDDTISRNNHAAIAYDDHVNGCFIGYGGKANLVRLNGRPCLSTEELSNGDIICVGQTHLRFVALCGEDFNWDATDSDKDTNGAQS